VVTAACHYYFTVYYHYLLNLNTCIMSLPWFKRIGIFFVPAALMGWLILLASVAAAVYVFIAVDNLQHSVSDALMNFVFHLLIIGAVYSLIAFMTIRVPGR
jgi:hypothetical protein